MRTLYLHIGFGKTGTTAVQDFLYRERIKLRDMGLFYPEVGLRGTGHHDLVTVSANEIDATTSRNLDVLTQELEASGTPSAILSSEFFCFLKERQITYLATRLQASRVRVIFYVRPQRKLIESAYLQWQRVGDDYGGSVREFFRRYGPAFNFMVRIAPWVKAFGHESVMARVFDPCIVGRDVCVDIMGLMRLGMPAEYRREGVVNPSLLPEFSALVAEVDSVQICETTRREIIDRLVSLSRKFKPLSDETVVDYDLQQDILNAYRDSNEEFSEAFLDERQHRVLCGECR